MWDDKKDFSFLFYHVYLVKMMEKWNDKKQI